MNYKKVFVDIMNGFKFVHLNWAVKFMNLLNICNLLISCNYELSFFSLLYKNSPLQNLDILVFFKLFVFTLVFIQTQLLQATSFFYYFFLYDLFRCCTTCMISCLCLKWHIRIYPVVQPFNLFAYPTKIHIYYYLIYSLLISLFLGVHIIKKTIFCLRSLPAICSCRAWRHFVDIAVIFRSFSFFSSN